MKPFLEQIQLGQKKSILAFRYEEQNFETPWHFHPQHELTYIEKSTGTKFIGDYVGSYEAGELVLMRSNLPHCWKNHIGRAEKSASTVVQWNKGIFPRIPEFIPLFQMLSSSSKGIHFAGNDIQKLIPLLKKLPSLQGHELYIEFLNILMELSVCTFQTLSASKFSDDLTSEFSSRMAKIHDFIEVQYNRKIYLKELADLVNISEQSFSRFFTKMMGRSFFTFLNEYRINVASRMLTETDSSVSQISYACGFESLPFFHKKFRLTKGSSPLKFRKMHMNKTA